MADKPAKRPTGKISAPRFICTNCRHQFVVPTAKPGEVLFCEKCDGSLVPVEAKDGKKSRKRHSTRLICTTCGASMDAKNYKSGDIVFCENCQGSMAPKEKIVPKERDFGKYRILGEIGRGGMGVVYRAKHLSLKRDVALKVLNPEEGSTPEMITSLHKEAQAASKLRHPNIVTVHDVDVFEGEHYIAMDFIDGQGLDQLLLKKPLKPPKAARLLMDVGAAVHYGHEKGIIHRDIKPSNILVDKEGKAYVMDFGIARDVRGGEDTGRAGTVMGTPGYMSPEQARGEKNIDRRSDVFSLGALLFFALTGNPPFMGSNTTESIDQTLSKDPLFLEDFPRAVPKDLAMICLKALNKDKESRYKSAGLLVDDLTRFVKGEDVLAVELAPFAKFLRTLVRYKFYVGGGLAAVIAIVVLAAVLGSSSATERTRRAEERRKAAAERKRQEEEARKTREELEKKLAEEKFENGKKSIVERVQARKEVARTSLKALEKTYHLDTAESLRKLEEIENNLRDLDRILVDAAEGNAKLLKRFEKDQEITENLYIGQDLTLIEQLRGKAYGAKAWAEWNFNLDAKKAVEYYNLAIQRHPNEISFYLSRGWIHVENDDFKKADQDLSIAFGNDPSLVANIHNLKYMLETKVRVGAFVEAEKLLARVPAATADWYFFAGLLANRKEDYDTAATRFQEAIAKHMTHARAHFWQGKNLLDAGKVDEALKKFNQIIAFVRMFKIPEAPGRSKRDNLLVKKPLAKTYLYRGIAALKTAEASGDAGQVAAAKKSAAADFQKALELVPILAEAKTWLGKVAGD
jgi:tetratricopeptide (TPR) repeat protein